MKRRGARGRMRASPRAQRSFPGYAGRSARGRGTCLFHSEGTELIERNTPTSAVVADLPCGRCFEHCLALGAHCLCPCHQRDVAPSARVLRFRPRAARPRPNTWFLEPFDDG